MTGDLLRKVTDFKRLDKKRVAQGLAPDEETRWQKLSAELGTALGPRPASAAATAGAPKGAAPAAPQSGTTPADYTRQELRVDTTLDVEFGDGADFEKAFVRNISGGGLYIETAMSLPAEKVLRLNIRIASPERILDVSAKVVWVNSQPSLHSTLKRGVGVKFVNLDEPTRTAIAELVHQSLDEATKKKT